MASASLISLREESYHVSKRWFDVVFSVLGLILSAPLMLIILIAVRLTSPGPIIFKQQRLGLNGNPFTIYKFRTMWVGSERGSSTTSYHDERITWAGKIVRPLRFDELPQLWNIIKGDMSLVGPRPHSIRHCEEVSSYIPGYYDRFQVMPGLTGLAQVNKMHNISTETHKMGFERDMDYIATRSLLMDLCIMVKTVMVVIKRKGN
jgi:lipopolysaccharide/colanic/teichoic acid biosynthesis glycosyltransferase